MVALGEKTKVGGLAPGEAASGEGVVPGEAADGETIAAGEAGVGLGEPPADGEEVVPGVVADGEGVKPGEAVVGGDGMGVRAAGTAVSCKPAGDLGNRVALGVAAAVLTGDAGTVAEGEVPGVAGAAGVGEAAYGEGVELGEDVVGGMVGAGVSVGLSTGGSVGVGARGSGEPPMSLAPFRGGDAVATGDGAAGVGVGLGVGEVPRGQRLQVAAQ